jgi:hypothetical protein
VIGVYLEVGVKRVFACALDWPGWCRVARSAPEALAELAEYAARYAPVAAHSGLNFPVRVAGALRVVEEVQGSATTDFGAPGAVAGADRARLTAAGAARLATLVDASWWRFDEVMRSAPASLRSGPRGGGRDRDKMIGHVLEAEAMYARKLGLRIDAAGYKDKAAVTAGRDAILAVLRSAREGTPPVDRGWPPRYAARRIAWHVLDHAWECEDRTP